MKGENFLEGVPAIERAALVERFHLRDWAQGAIVISHLDQGRDVFFVLKGRVRATLYSPNGREIDYRDVGPGDIVGELAAIDGAPRSATVQALEPSQLGRLSEAEFHDLVEKRPQLAWALLRHLSAQVRRLTERIFEHTTLVARDRLIHELMRLAKEAGVRDGRAEIRPAPTHYELSSRIGAHREAVSREMSALAKAGLVQKSGRALVMRDLEQLARLVADAG